MSFHPVALSTSYILLNLIYYLLPKTTGYSMVLRDSRLTMTIWIGWLGPLPLWLRQWLQWMRLYLRACILQLFYIIDMIHYVIWFSPGTVNASAFAPMSMYVWRVAVCDLRNANTFYGMQIHFMVDVTRWLMEYWFIYEDKLHQNFICYGTIVESNGDLIMAR